MEINQTLKVNIGRMGSSYDEGFTNDSEEFDSETIEKSERRF